MRAVAKAQGSAASPQHMSDLTQDVRSNSRSTSERVATGPRRIGSRGGMNSRRNDPLISLPATPPETDRQTPALARDVARVVAVRDLLADLAVLAVNHQLRALISREGSSAGDRFILCREGVALLAVYFQRPLVPAWNYVNIAHAIRLPAPIRAVQWRETRLPRAVRWGPCAPPRRQETDRPGALAGPLRSGNLSGPWTIRDARKLLTRRVLGTCLRLA